MTPALIIFVAFVVSGTLIALLGIPMWLRKVPPNPMYGLRTRATLRDEHVWYDANARSGRDSVAVGAVIAATAIGLFVADVRDDIAGWVNVAVTLIAVVAMGVRGWRFAKQLDAARVRGESPKA